MSSISLLVNVWTELEDYSVQSESQQLPKHHSVTVQEMPLKRQASSLLTKRRTIRSNRSRLLFDTGRKWLLLEVSRSIASSAFWNASRADPIGDGRHPLGNEDFVRLPAAIAEAGRSRGRDKLVSVRLSARFAHHDSYRGSSAQAAGLAFQWPAAAFAVHVCIGTGACIGGKLLRWRTSMTQRQPHCLSFLLRHGASARAT